MPLCGHPLMPLCGHPLMPLCGHPLMPLCGHPLMPLCGHPLMPPSARTSDPLPVADGWGLRLRGSAVRLERDDRHDPGMTRSVLVWYCPNLVRSARSARRPSLVSTL